MWVHMRNLLLTVAVVTEGTFQQAVESHETDLLKHVQAVLTFRHKAAPFCLRCHIHTGREAIRREGKAEQERNVRDI